MCKTGNDIIDKLMDIYFFTDGSRSRVICTFCDKHTVMFQTSDDRYLEHYWNWSNYDDRNEILSTKDSYEKSKWRQLSNDGPDKCIIRNLISALNYNKRYSEIDETIRLEIDSIIANSRSMWEFSNDEIPPDPIPFPNNKIITNFLNLNIISKYGVTLRRLTHDKIELVRRWRNDPKISKFMEYRDVITPEMQEIWFKKIDNINNFYFIIEAEGKEIGLINIRDIDYEIGNGEPGIFIWDDDFLNSTYSFRSVLNLTDFCFETLGLKELVIHVLKDNKRAIQFNKAYGYEISQNQDGVYNQEYRMDYSRYKSKRNKIIKLLK